MECHPSIPPFRDLIKMYQQTQTGTHLDHTLDSAFQDRMRTSSCVALRSSITLFMPDLSIEVLLTMWHHKKTPFSSLTNYRFFSLPTAITPWPCLNILIHRVKQQYSQFFKLLLFSILSVTSLKYTISVLENNPSFVLQQAICHKGLKQSSMSAYNLHKLQQLKCVIFGHK